MRAGEDPSRRLLDGGRTAEDAPEHLRVELLPAVEGLDAVLLRKDVRQLRVAVAEQIG